MNLTQKNPILQSLLDNFFFSTKMALLHKKVCTVGSTNSRTEKQEWQVGFIVISTVRGDDSLSFPAVKLCESASQLLQGTARTSKVLDFISSINTDQIWNSGLAPQKMWYPHSLKWALGVHCKGRSQACFQVFSFSECPIWHVISLKISLRVIDCEYYAKYKKQSGLSFAVYWVSWLGTALAKALVWWT